MSTFLLLAALLAAAPTDGALPVELAVEKPVAPLRTGRDLEAAVRAALRQWAKPAENEAQPAAHDFLALYNELQRDTLLARTTRDQLTAKVRSRLTALAQQISKQSAGKKRSGDRPASVDVAQGAGVLAQWGGFGRQPGGFGPAMPRQVVNDNAGMDLVDLIQTTIAPTTWQRNGGPGSIYYWRPGRAIAVSANQDVHDQVGNLLEQMDRLGR